MTGSGLHENGDKLVGTTLAGRYLVEARLGEGGMGAVYQARHATLDKKVAVKVLHTEFSQKEEFVRRFLQEAKAASKIRNQHVIDITDFGNTDDNFVFFAMEFLEGRDLHELFKQVRVKTEYLLWERSSGIISQICEALSAAHASGIIHRDLKPENVFLVERPGQTDFVKLLDFGIAKVQTDGCENGERKLTKTGMLFGTPEYMAPEQAKGEKPDHRVDIYAMGCLLYQFVTGAVPFSGDNFMAILTQHIAAPVPQIGADVLARIGAPAEIVPILNRALAKERDQRYPDIASFAQAVENAGRAHPTIIGSPYSDELRTLQDPNRSGLGNVQDDGLAVVLDDASTPTRVYSPKRTFAVATGLILAAGGIGYFATQPRGNEKTVRSKKGELPMIRKRVQSVPTPARSPEFQAPDASAGLFDASVLPAPPDSANHMSDTASKGQNDRVKDKDAGGELSDVESPLKRSSDKPRKRKTKTPDINEPVLKNPFPEN